MKKRMLACLLGLMMLVGMVCPAAYAAEDEAVEAVIAQLEAIDSLQQMQDARSNYTVKNAHYDTGTTNTAVIEEHEAARSAYESYVAEMFAARVAAQQAYDADRKSVV